MVQFIEYLNSKCPISFNRTDKKNSPHEYPYNPSYLVPLYVAVASRGININSIDFIFGGSVLQMLASAKITKNVEYWAQQKPGTKVVAVEKKQSYSTNWNDFGHSFERFVPGQCNTYYWRYSTIYSLALYKIFNNASYSLSPKQATSPVEAISTPSIENAPRNRVKLNIGALTHT